MRTERVHNGPLVAGTLLIVFGALSLASRLFPNIVNWSILWPFVIILFGSLFFAGMFLGGRQVSGLAIPGAIITGIGLLLLYQNYTSHWESWAYSWALIVLFVGLGIYIAGVYAKDEGQSRAGLKVMKVGFILFIIFGAFFEMIFSMDQALGFKGVLFPSLLILLGIYLIVRRLGLLGERTAAEAETPTTPEPPSAPQ
jgi:peptidoglycan/LPS O-acetylase OafA/YrhL